MRTRLRLSAAVSIILFLAACGSSQGQTSHGKPSQGAAGRANPGQAPVNPCVPGTCGVSVNGATTTTQAGGGGARSRDLQAWSAAHLAGLQALSSEANHLLSGAGTPEQVKLACNQLGADAQAALSSPPPPDAGTAARLQAGLTQLGQLSRDCTAAFNSGDTTAASRLVYEANQATATINEVIRTMNGAGHPVS